MGWRQTPTAEALAALLKIMQFDRDPSVPAAVANSLSMFPSEAIAHLAAAFRGDENQASWIQAPGFIRGVNTKI